MTPGEHGALFGTRSSLNSLVRPAVPCELTWPCIGGSAPPHGGCICFSKSCFGGRTRRPHSICDTSLWTCSVSRLGRRPHHSVGKSLTASSSCESPRSFCSRPE